MKNVAQRADRLVNAILPLAFFGSGFLNMVSYILGLHAFDTVRTVFNVGILGAAALLCFSQVVLLYLRTPVLRRTLQAASMILVLFGLIYLWALLIQTKKTMILKEASTSWTLEKKSSRPVCWTRDFRHRFWRSKLRRAVKRE